MVGKDSHQVDQKRKKRNFLQEKRQKFWVKASRVNFESTGFSVA
jgi:hypothetical protein